MLGIPVRKILRSFIKPEIRKIEFEPYIKELPVEGCPCRFLYATFQAQEWYDPMKPYAKAEYDWVVKNVDLKNQIIIEGTDSMVCPFF